MAEAFYPFVEPGADSQPSVEPQFAARIAVYDDPLATPRVVEIAPTDTRTYLEQITEAVNRLSHEAGSHIPFMVTRELVENLIHAYFAQPTISILDNGDTITFSDQGPGIADKDLARQYGTTSATAEMRQYIRGVGSGLPYVEAWLAEHDGRLEIQDNISGGTMVTISLLPGEHTQSDSEQAAVPQAQPIFAPQNPPYGYPVYQQPQQVVPQAVPVLAPAYPYQAVQPQPAATVLPYPVTHPTFTEREEQALAYLASHAEVGPTDLHRAYGQSVPTWARVLKGLEDKGVVRKDGQKRTLTEAGRQFLGA